MRILYTKKAEGGQPRDQVVRAFENAESLDEVRSAVEQSEDRLYVTWASVEAKDTDGEIIPVDDLIEQNAILMERGAPISDEHTNRIVGKTLAWKVLEHPETGTYGILHLNQIYDHNELDDQVWSEIQSGERGGSSVGGVSTGMSVQMGEDGKGVHRIDGFSWMETASTGNPVNPYATNEAFSVVAKSRTPNTRNKDYNGPRTVVRRGFKKSGTNQEATQPETIKMQDTNKRRVYLKPGQEAPAGAQVQTGSGGGRYYETSPGPGNENAPLPAEEQALGMFQEGQAAEDIIENLVSDGEDFDDAIEATVGAVNEYAYGAQADPNIDKEEVQEFKTYLNALTPEDLNLEGSTAQEPGAGFAGNEGESSDPEGRPAEAEPGPDAEPEGEGDNPPAPEELHDELRELKEEVHRELGPDETGIDNSDLQGIVEILGMQYDIDEDAILDWIRGSTE